MFEIAPCRLDGVFAVRPRVRPDSRGYFAKIVHRDYFAAHGLPSDFAEQYYSVSAGNVLRGMHFQVPPHHHYKLVTCIDGEVMDVVVDLRHRSPTYGEYQCFDLSGERADSVFIPAGFAHGFYVRSAQAMLFYNVETVYAPAHDTGIRWDSARIPWPIETPLVSDRDAALPPLSEFKTPF